MKKRRKNTGHRFKITAYRQPSRTALSEMEPEEFAVYVRRAEKRALPTIKEMRLGPGAAQLLLAQHAQVLATGDPRLTPESITAARKSSHGTLASWVLHARTRLPLHL